MSKWLEDVDYAEAVEVRVAAPPERAFEAALAATLREMPLTFALLVLRGLPGRLTGRRAFSGIADRPLLDLLLSQPGFLLLHEPADGYALYGYVGRPWQLAGEGVRLAGPGEFCAFDTPGYAKVVMDLRADPCPGGSMLGTETRIHLTDEHARRAFRRYWRVVKPGSNALRRSWLRAARRRAAGGA